MLLQYEKTLTRTAVLFAAVALGTPSGLVAGADPTKAEESPGQQCDHYAARGFGLAATATGVSFEELDPKMAIAACEAAVRRDPKNGRLLFQLGRGYEKAGKFADALDRYGQAAAASYAPAYASIGNMYSRGRGVEKDER